MTASKAKEKGTSASLVAKLHYGVTQFVAEANASLLSKTNTQVKQLSSRFLVSPYSSHNLEELEYVLELEFLLILIKSGLCIDIGSFARAKEWKTLS